ncbi:alpha/beta-Hydrolases superfamily protein [Thalictrum thalictroides]|uniref:Alpha/beta-Hydrolases superfamily protein n=1 Tax=Thalictrum thalictroides TaxID=46969 RepID=A0A7J6UXR0_THATH|nr:alpha/beta-Hydrolases superfamily protein [Thalictrum thalictroides]
MGKLLEKLGVEKYSVMGTSYGGFVAYNMAKLFENRVEKVVIASSGINRILKDHKELLERAKVDKIEDLMLPKTASQLKNLMELALFKPSMYLPKFLLNDFITTLYSDNLKEKKELLMGLTFGFDDEVRASPLPQDVLIVWGDHDQIFPLKKAVELNELLGDKARLEVIKNTSHIPQAEDANKFNDIVIKFLSGHRNSLL